METIQLCNVAVKHFLFKNNSTHTTHPQAALQSYLPPFVYFLLIRSQTQPSTTPSVSHGQMTSSRIQQANAAVEEDIQNLSDELDEEVDDDDAGDDMDFGGRLPVPVSYNRTLLELYSNIPPILLSLTNVLDLVKDARYMNINPDYQRDVVWSEQRMVHLIDSLFRNFYVPPLIFKVVSGTKPGTNERRRWRTCIDGKQRLTTIRKFFDGEIPYVDKRRQRWYYCDPNEGTGRSTRKLISQEEKDFINNVTIVNIEFEQLSEEQEEDMFQRVQLGVPLTVAEKLAAMSGEIPDFIKSLRTTFPMLVTLIGTKRSTDFRLVTQLLYLLHDRIREGEDLKLSTSQSTLKKFLEDDPRRIMTASFRAQVRRVFTKYNELVEDHNDIFTHSYGAVNATMRKFSPVEFLGVGVLLDMYPDRPTRVLAQDIQGLREYLRARLHDLRSNTMTWTKIMEYVITLEEERGYFFAGNERGNVAKRARVPLALVSPKNPGWNPPPLEQQIPIQSTSTFNEWQQRLHDARIASLQAEQRDAFTRLPPARPIANQNAGGAVPVTRQAPVSSLNGSTKRTIHGEPVKREHN
jgi:hypothetical protein